MESPSGSAHRGSRPWIGLLITVSLLTFWNPPITAQITVELVPPNVAEGKQVLLLVHNIPPNPARYDWYRNEFDENQIIITWTVKTENTTPGPLYSNRETIYSNGSLLIQNLTMRDSGMYAVRVITENFDSLVGTGQVPVHELLPRPNITANNSSPVEQEDSVELTCKPESRNTIYRWFINTQLVKPSTKLQLSPDHRTLTVFHITRKDTGPYECEISNPVSVNRSDPFILSVIYGPDAPIISPSKRDYHLGENLILSCLTDSNPPAQFVWFMGEKNLASTQTLTIPNLSLNDSGSYSCLVGNSVIRLNRTSVIGITVSGKGTTDIPVGTFLSILIGVLIGVKLTAAIGYFLFLRRSEKSEAISHLFVLSWASVDLEEGHPFLGFWLWPVAPPVPPRHSLFPSSSSNCDLMDPSKPL